MLTEGCKGSPAHYWVLRIFSPEGKMIAVHTSKDYSYICRLTRDLNK